MPQIQLITSDEVIFKANSEILQKWETIRTMFETLNLSSDSLESIGVLPLKNVNSIILKEVLAWSNHHQAHPSTCQQTKHKLCIWDMIFLNKNNEILYDLIMAANYLNIEELLDTLIAPISYLLDLKSVDEIREMFGIESDFTAAERKEILYEHEWLHQDKLTD